MPISNDYKTYGIIKKRFMMAILTIPRQLEIYKSN